MSQSSADLRAQLEANTLEINGLRSTLTDLRRHRDFPHNVKAYLATLQSRQSILEKEQRELSAQLQFAYQCVDSQYLANRIEEIELTIETALEVRQALLANIESTSASEATDKANKPVLAKLESCMQSALSLPQEQLSKLIATLLEQAKANNGSGTTSSVAKSGDGNKSDESGSNTSVDPYREPDTHNYS